MKIFTQFHDCKFIRSLEYLGNNYNVACATINKDIYKIHYQYNFDMYIFCEHLMDDEIVHFIKEFGSEKRMICYHTKAINSTVVDQFSGLCKHIGHSVWNNVTKIPYLTLPNVFHTTLAPSESLIKNTSYSICFLEQDTIPVALGELLYPNQKHKIKIFNRHIQHPQIAGWATEPEKAYLLNKYAYYLIDGEDYLLEAINCGATIVGYNRNTRQLETHDTAKLLASIDYVSYQKFIDSLI